MISPRQLSKVESSPDFLHQERPDSSSLFFGYVKKNMKKSLKRSQTMMDKSRKNRLGIQVTPLVESFDTVSNQIPAKKSAEKNSAAR